MGIFDLFSKRQARLRGEVPDVYRYDLLPQALRVQMVHVARDLLAGGRDENFANSQPNAACRFITDVLRREYGVFQLGDDVYGNHPARELFNFILQSKNHEHVLDAVEFIIRYADRATRKWEYLSEVDGRFNDRVDSAIGEINERFKEHGIGYQYEDGQLLRLDSDLIHAEAVKPALTLLRTSKFAGPREEFLGAYEHYRHGRHEEALTEALKAFESTMKAICDNKKWPYDAGATAKKLVEICFKNGLINTFWQSHLSHLQGTLEGGITTARNKMGGHGQGAQPRAVPKEIVTYVLHMTASTIVFLIESAGA